MYLSHFGMRQPPFAMTPNPDFFYAGNQRGDILAALVYAVTQGEGIIKVTGEVGSGKTMLCRMLEHHLPAHVEVIYLVNPTLSREQVGFAIAGELGLPVEGRRADEVIRLLQADLIAKHVAGKQVVLLIEEAQAMPLDTLEEIRLFSNLETAHHKLLQIVLFGQPELDVSLALPRMRQLKERITHSFEVPPLAPARLPEFLMFRMRAAGYCGPDVFTKAALRQIADVSEGIVRRVSILADKALLAAFADNTHSITARHVRAAALDSQFSPYARRRFHPYAGAAALAGGAALLLAGALYLRAPSSSAPPAARQQAAAPAAPATATPAAPLASPAASRMASQTSAPAAPVAAQLASPTGAVSGPPTTMATAEGIDQRIANQLRGSRAWFAQQDSQAYTLQIALADGERQKLVRLLRKADEDLGLEQLHVFPARLGASARAGVVYSVFASKADALAMKQQLAAEWGYRPQLRRIAGIREELKHLPADAVWPE